MQFNRQQCGSNETEVLFYGLNGNRYRVVKDVKYLDATYTFHVDADDLLRYRVG